MEGRGGQFGEACRSSLKDGTSGSKQTLARRVPRGHADTEQEVFLAEGRPGLCIWLSHDTSLTVHHMYFAVLPSFTKIPHDIAIRTGTMARLECAATGHPNPQIAWQKDGGTDFPAARERRMHVMPDDDVFFITDVKIDDMGVYSCTAQNSAGTVSANATLTVLGPTTHTRST